MGLSASMWTGVSGLLAHGNKMNVVGNNLANVSTIGFKSQRMDFNDYLYISSGSTSGPVQIGAGVGTYALIGDFSQGSLESTNSVTDIAIDGEGFFKVRQPNSEQMYYTRAGDFYFNADRQLQNPEGYRLQGWKISNSSSLTFKNDSVNLGRSSANESAFQGTGTPVDIVLDSWYLEPQRTSSVNFTMGLTSDGKSDKSTSTTSPMTALFDQWDAGKNPPMADSAYATSSPIKVYDEAGNAHTLTVYYDQVATQAKDADGSVIYEIDGLPAGYTMYEYIVTIPPEEDMRSYGGTGFNEETNEFDGNQPTKFYDDPVKGTNKNAGMLMTGHLIFDTAGNLVNQTAYTYGATADPDNKNQCDLDPEQLGSWQATKFSSNGLPVFCANFSGQPLANSVSEKISATQSQAQDYIIELDLGLRTAGDWGYAGSLEDLKGVMVDPIVNTETRISLGSKTAYPKVTYTAATTDGPAKWVTKEGDTTSPIPVDETAASQPDIFISLKKGTDTEDSRYPILTTTKGACTMWVDPDSRKEVTEGTDGAVLCYQGADGKPVMQDDDLLALWDTSPAPDGDGPLTTDAQTLANDPGNAYLLRDKTTKGTANFSLAQTQKIIPQNIRNGDYNKIDAKTGKVVQVNLEKDAYAQTEAGQYYIRFNADGVITGISKQRKSEIGDTPPDEADDDQWNAYNNEPIFFPKATASRKIDYNTDVSTFDDPIRAENASKAGGTSFVIQDAGQNGYSSGVLSGTDISADGVVSGYYDNGKTVPLYQIALYDFHNKQGLRREGGNLYAQTRESGEARQGVAGEAGFGNTKAYNIEASNVDMSREFVNMISTQRGFQANSKTVTTVDTMLETVIGMKR